MGWVESKLKCLLVAILAYLFVVVGWSLVGGSFARPIQSRLYFVVEISWRTHANSLSQKLLEEWIVCTVQ
jgi:hypothetical protein